MWYTYPGTTGINVPLYDIFGSTIAMVDAINNPNVPFTNYTYDPYGMVTTDHNGQRPPWPFLYHGMEQEYPDSWKLVLGG